MTKLEERAQEEMVERALKIMPEVQHDAMHCPYCEPESLTARELWKRSYSIVRDERRQMFEIPPGIGIHPINGY